jgi:hypothetical protein
MADVRLTRFTKIIRDAKGSLSKRRSRSTKLYLDVQGYRPGITVGPPVQRIKTKEACFVVFVDDEPRANFSHPCRYRFYDARSQKFIRETRAQFPPYVNFVPRTYLVIHDPDKETPHGEQDH